MTMCAERDKLRKKGLRHHVWHIEFQFDLFCSLVGFAPFSVCAYPLRRVCDSLMSPKNKKTSNIEHDVTSLLLPILLGFWIFCSCSAWPRVKTARHCEIYFLSHSFYVCFTLLLFPQIHWFFKHTPHKNTHKLWQYNKPNQKSTRPRNRPTREEKGGEA